MATLSDSEIEKLFSGAPQYFARSEGHYTGAPHPSVPTARGLPTTSENVSVIATWRGWSGSR